MIIVPLGVASATPTATRHLSSLAVWREGTVFLFDCGEGAQMRMLQAGIKRSKIKYIFISHFDYDHFTGLIGLLSTLQLQRRDQALTLVGPKGLKEYVDWNFKFIDVELSYPIDYVELEEGFEHQVVVDADEYYVEARPLKHSRFCIGFRLQERDKPGKVDGAKAAELGITEDQHFKDL
ncbi:MBL fold metallo-hydrolase, partial [Arthrospira platensis SPKY1]|nr:MBL fold metallo-hydrolase [Arthrospira platensis SPKY1]